MPENSIDKKNVFSKPNSSIILQVTLYFDQVYCWLYIISVMLLFTFKGYILPYPPGSLGPEIVATIFFVLIQSVRLYIASIGNKTETAMYIFYSLILGIPVTVGYIYFFRFQTYVIVFDMCFNIIGLVFIVAELIFSLIAIFNIKSNES